MISNKTIKIKTNETGIEATHIDVTFNPEAIRDIMEHFFIIWQIDRNTKHVLLESTSIKVSLKEDNNFISVGGDFETFIRIGINEQNYVYADVLIELKGKKIESEEFIFLRK